MKSILVLSSLFMKSVALLIMNDDLSTMHNEWMVQFNRTYTSPEEQQERLEIFSRNVDLIFSHNEKFANGEETFSMALNGHADLSFPEWKSKMLTFVASPMVENDPYHLGEHQMSPLRLQLTSIDWRTSNAVTPVKDQGQCGSCWSFSSTGAMEGAHAIATKQLVSLSEEQLINCVNGGQFDCNTGGDMVEAFKYVISNKGIVTESSYPYASKDHQKCKYKAGSGNYAATFSGYKTIPANDEVALQSAVSKQPIAIAIDASHSSFQFYSTGVYSDKACCTNCQPNQLDHGVLLIGFGSESGNDYWLVKNSWNTGWGDKGYIKIAKGKKGMCGVPAMASYPIV